MSAAREVEMTKSSLSDKDKEKAARTPVIGVAGEQPSFMYNKTIIANENGSDNL